jgi:hypothetical protein
MLRAVGKCGGVVFVHCLKKRLENRTTQKLFLPLGRFIYIRNKRLSWVTAQQCTCTTFFSCYLNIPIVRWMSSALLEIRFPIANNTPPSPHPQFSLEFSSRVARTDGQLLLVDGNDRWVGTVNAIVLHFLISDWEMSPSVGLTFSVSYTFCL